MCFEMEVLQLMNIYCTGRNLHIFFLQKYFELFIYYREETCPEHVIAFRFSLDYTVFPHQHLETKKMQLLTICGNTNFRYIFLFEKNIILHLNIKERIFFHCSY